MNEPTKTCTQCKQELSINQFYRTSPKEGSKPRATCKECYKAKLSPKSKKGGKRGRPLGTRTKAVYPDDNTKVCTGCNRAMPLNCFYVRHNESKKHQITVHMPTCKECNKRRTVRQAWKNRTEKEGVSVLTEHITKLRTLLEEAETMLQRRLEGKDMVNW